MATTYDMGGAFVVGEPPLRVAMFLEVTLLNCLAIRNAVDISKDCNVPQQGNPGATGSRDI